MLCGEDVLNPIGGRGVYMRQMCDYLCEYVDIVIFSPTPAGCEPGFFVASKEVTEKIDPANWYYRKGFYRIYNSFFLNDYPVINDKTIVEVNGKKVGVHGHGKVIFEEMKAYHNFMNNFALNLRDLEFDLIHAHDTDMWFVAETLSYYYNCPKVVSIHLSVYLGPQKMYKSAHWRLSVTREALAYTDAAAIHTLSNYYKNKVVEWMPLIEDKITVIPNAINHDYLQTIRFNLDERKKRLGKYEKIIVLVGRLVPQKGIDFFLEAVREFPQYKFILISVYSFTHDKGATELAQMAKRTLEECPNFEWESHCGQDLKWDLMKIADIGLVPSRYGSYEIVVGEWMALRVPTIISTECPIIEYLPGQCCDIIEPSADALIDAIRNFNYDEAKVDLAWEFTSKNGWRDNAFTHYEFYKKIMRDLNDTKIHTVESTDNIPV